MLQLTNVSVNYGRLKESVRTRLIEAGASATFTWGALSDRSDAYQSACRARLSGDGLAWDSGWVEQRAQEERTKIERKVQEKLHEGQQRVEEEVKKGRKQVEKGQ